MSRAYNIDCLHTIISRTVAIIAQVLVLNIKLTFLLLSGFEFSIPNVVNNISLVPDWQGLGILLGLTVEEIAMINSYPDQREHRQRLIETLFARDPDCSWEKLRRAIYEQSNRRASYDSAISSVPSTPTSPPGTYEYRALN